MTVRAARGADLDAVVAVEQQSMGADAWSATAVRAELAGRTRHVLVGGRPVSGWAVLMVAGDTADVLRVAVLPAARRSGLGRALLDGLLAEAVGRGCDRVLLEVAAANAPARALYAAAGFAVLDHRPDYYGRDRDALVLSLDL